MKNTLLNSSVFLLLIILFAQCTRQPNACIDQKRTWCYVGDKVSYTNCSTDYKTSLWTTSDGQEEDYTNMDVTFIGSGEYTVELEVFSKNRKKSDKTTNTISVWPTHGDVTFWQSGSPSYYVTLVTIDSYQEFIWTDYPSGISSCNFSNCANFNLEQGWYTYYAEENIAFGVSWGGSFLVEAGKCTTIKLP